MKRLREEQRAERVVLAGHSMGTAAIMQYARLYPEHTVALVLVEGSVSMPATGHFVMLEKPAQFNALLKSFVDKLKY